MPEMMLQKKKGIQQMMKTPITVPSVFAAFVSFAKRETFLRGAWSGEAPLEALPPPPLWMRNVISPSAPPPTDESCFVPVGKDFQPNNNNNKKC
jgi:hypothetical protein